MSEWKLYGATRFYKSGGEDSGTVGECGEPRESHFVEFHATAPHKPGFAEACANAALIVAAVNGYEAAQRNAKLLKEAVALLEHHDKYASLRFYEATQGQHGFRGTFEEWAMNFENKSRAFLTNLPKEAT